MNALRQRLMAILFLAFVALLTPANAAATTNEPVRVLFLGNSYTYVNDLPGMMRGISQRESRPLEPTAVTGPGATLRSHWNSQIVRDLLRTQRWDYVVLQEQSTMPLREREIMFDYARRLDADIRKAGGKSVFFLTWARAESPGDQVALTDAYTKIAGELDAKVVPVGAAWQRWHNGTNGTATLYLPDGSHPNPLGTYLAACVFYGTLCEKSAVGLEPHCIDTQFKDGRNGETKMRALKPQLAHAAQECADETVREFQTRRTGAK